MMKVKRWILLALIPILCFCTPAEAANSGSWTETFSYSSAQEMLDTDLWDLEGNDLPMGISGREPSLEDGHLILEEKESVELHWPAIPQMGPFSEESAYTLTFDVQLLDWQGDSGWSGSRELYVGAGGWYNLLELKNGSVNTANSGVWDAFDPEELLHVNLFWQGTTISTSVYGEDGRVVSMRSRRRAEFVDMEALSHTMERWVFRCEDGAVALSNLSFSKETPEWKKETFPLQGQSHCSGIIQVEKNGTAALSCDGGELLRFHCGTLTIGGIVEGIFPAGEYPVQIDLNLPQKNALVTITLPDGREIRRGDSQLLGNAQQISSLTFMSTEGCAFSLTETTTPATDLRQYNLPQQPAESAFDSLAWNLTSSFDADGKTTRSFAWTAIPSLTEMAVRYAPSTTFAETGQFFLTEAAAEAPTETANQQFLYYKADLTNLSPGTEYTYQIGDIEANQWSPSYTFTTEEDDLEDFSFLVISDTQSFGWDGGYRYTAAALEYGLEMAPDARFILHGGDIVSHGSVESQWTAYFRSLKGIAERIPVFATIGNHDTWSTTSEKPLGDLLFDLHLNHPNNGGILSGKENFTGTAMKNLQENIQETFYSFDYGNVHVIVLNSGTFVQTSEDNRLLELQRQWLEQDLAASGAKWNIALVHQGVYHRSNKNWYCNALQDLLEEAGVDLVFHGHEHLVKRTYPIRNGEIVVTQDPDVIPKGAGTVYSTVGSTVTAHDHLQDSIEECLLVNGLDDSQATCTVVHADQNSLTVEVRSLNGLVADAFTIVDLPEASLSVEVDGEEAQISQLLSGKEAQLVLQTPEETNCTVMAATYTSEGKMVKCISVFTGSLPKGGSLRKDFCLPAIPEEVEYLQFYLWESNTVQPLCSPWKVSE